MIKKIGGFFEAHVEKIVLIIVGLLCAWLLITRVLLTPNVFEHDGKKLSPGALDEQLLKEVQEISRGNSSNTIDLVPSNNMNYSALFTNSLSDIDFDWNIKPDKGEVDTNPEYARPDISRIRIDDAQIEYIRTVAYEPVEEITKSNLYDDKNSEPNDIDLITVSAEIDIKSIIDEFENCYINGVRQELQDPCKAKPIFAQVNLQRQQLLPNGQWSDWDNIPRAKNDYNKKVFKYVEDSSDLPLGGYEIYKFQLNHAITQLDLLQPEPYQFAMANDQWLPPELHGDFLKAQSKDERDARRAADNDSSSSSSSSTTGSSRRRDRGTTGTTTTTTGGRRGRDRGTTGTTTTTTGGRRGRGSTTTTTTDTSYNSADQELYVEEVYEDFQSIILTNDTDLTELIDPIMFWAYDDTAQPNNTYRYRVRVGVLNPAPIDENDDVILWSNYSNVTDEVHIPGKIYFFAGEVQEAAKTVSVSVYKLHLGYWYKKVFDRVAQGEMIGSIAEVDAKKYDEDDSDIDEDETVTIDFTTGATMVDVVLVSEWTGGSSSNPQPYYNMLYTYDGEEILQIPATRRPDNKIWPSDLYRAYRDVQNYINDDYEPLESWGEGAIDFENLRSGGMIDNLSYR